MPETINKEQVLDWVRSATMVEIANLVKDIETEFGVTAAALQHRLQRGFD